MSSARLASCIDDAIAHLLFHIPCLSIVRLKGVAEAAEYLSSCPHVFEQCREKKRTTLLDCIPKLVVLTVLAIVLSYGVGDTSQPS